MSDHDHVGDHDARRRIWYFSHHMKAEERRLSESRQLAALSSSDPDAARGLLLSIEAWRLGRTAEARGALVDASERANGLLAFLRGDRSRARRLNYRRDFDRDAEDSATHAKHPHQASIDIHGTFDVGDGWRPVNLSQIVLLVSRW